MSLSLNSSSFIYSFVVVTGSYVLEIRWVLWEGQGWGLPVRDHRRRSDDGRGYVWCSHSVPGGTPTAASEFVDRLSSSSLCTVAETRRLDRGEGKIWCLKRFLDQKVILAMYRKIFFLFFFWEFFLLPSKTNEVWPVEEFHLVKSKCFR